MRKWLIELRNKAGITQAEMAKKLNLSQSYYAQIEAGERQRNLNLLTATSLAKIFKISVATISKYEQARSERSGKRAIHIQGMEPL